MPASTSKIVAVLCSRTIKLAGEGTKPKGEVQGEHT
jgi:hypothetical protein